MTCMAECFLNGCFKVQTLLETRTDITEKVLALVWLGNYSTTQGLQDVIQFDLDQLEAQKHNTACVVWVLRKQFLYQLPKRKD